MKRLGPEEFTSIIHALESQPCGLGIAEILKRTGMSDRMARTRLMELRRRKLALLIGPQGNNYAVWCLTKHAETAREAFEAGKEARRQKDEEARRQRERNRRKEARPEPVIAPMVIPASVWDLARVSA